MDRGQRLTKQVQRQGGKQVSAQAQLAALSMKIVKITQPIRLNRQPNPGLLAGFRYYKNNQVSGELEL